MLSAEEEERELDVPLNGSSEQQDFADGQWVLATFIVGDRSTSVAGCMMDRGAGLQLAFSDRDWETLTEFSELAPPQSGPPTMRCPPIAETVDATGTRVMVIDGENETREVTRALLEVAGYQITAVSSAEMAFETLRVADVDLIVCECTLPGMSGLEFCRRLRKDTRHAGLPLVFLTTHQSQRRVMEAFECGADEYMTKPFREPELSARVISVLRRAHQRAS